MKPTGIVRTIDVLGRKVISKQYDALQELINVNTLFQHDRDSQDLRCDT